MCVSPVAQRPNEELLLATVQVNGCIEYYLLMSWERVGALRAESESLEREGEQQEEDLSDSLRLEEGPESENAPRSLPTSTGECRAELEEPLS